MKTTKFRSLGIGDRLCKALAEFGYHEPTAIQAQAIPELLAGKDILGIAQTGTGKTAAFALPILQTLLANNVSARPKRPKVLILAPTRELAAQIRDEASRYAGHTPIRIACVFGGVNQNPQVRALARGVELVVATPGRLLDLANNRHVDLREISHLVLDEADRLLDMGFIRDVKKIISMVPSNRQSLLFSATMPREVSNLATEILYQPARINVAPKQITVNEIEQGVVIVDTKRKQKTLETLLHDPDVTRAIVFTRTKHGANRVAQKLDRAGITAEAIHGNKSQNARRRALESFKSGPAWVLVATDIAARGIDIPGISHVINFELPHEPESYVHRIGRTARAGAHGVAWSLVDPTETSRLRAVERLTKVRATPMQIDVADAESGTEVKQGRRNAHAQSARWSDQAGDGRGRSRNHSRRRGRRRKTAQVA